MIQHNTAEKTVQKAPSQSLPKNEQTKVYHIPKDPFSQIERLERILPFYRMLARSDYPRWSYQNFKKGDDHPSILKLRIQLSMMGFPLQKKKSFDHELEQTIRKFQKTSNLSQTGKISLSMWRILHQKNKLPLLEKVLKKWQKIAPYMTNRFIFINIPKYTLYAFSGPHLEFTQKVIVGRRDRKTPELLPTWMTHLVLNPSWTLPPTIFLQDKLRKIQSDPGYLVRRGYIVQDQYGQSVNPYKVKWQYVSKHYMPYKVKLPPSESNPLGDIKFHLNNTKAIFMHGTPQENLFYKANRALSSGCIRVEDEYELGAWLRYGNLSDETIQSLIQKVEEGGTQHLSLKTHVPVLIANITTWIDKNYHIQMLQSPYNV